MLCLVGLVAACTRAEDTQAPPPGATLFTRMPSSWTGIRFENRVPDTQLDNVFTYRNHYNGGGVAIGDLNGDGLPEIVLTSNTGGVRLFLNEGQFRFRDVTEAAGLRADAAWTTGVAIADVDGDGRLDLYICRAGMPRPEGRANALFLNEGNGPDGVPHFVDRAKAYGCHGEAVDGNDTLAVYEATRVAIDRARKGLGPTLIEADTMRMRGHAEHDDMKYVPRELVEEWAKKDPILRYERHLLDRGLATAFDLAAVVARIEASLAEDLAFAEKSPFPDPASGMSGVYADRPVADPTPPLVREWERGR